MMRLRLAALFALVIVSATTVFAACVGDDAPIGGPPDGTDSSTTTDGPSSTNDGSPIDDASTTSDGGADADANVVPSGDFAWLYHVDVHSTLYQPVVASAANGDVIIGATFFGGIDVNGTPADAGAGAGLLLARLRADKSVIWARVVDTGNGGGFSELAVDANGDIYGTGGFNAVSFLGITGNTSQNNLGFAAKFLGANGNLVWASKLGSVIAGNETECGGIAANGPAGVVAVGCYFLDRIDYLGVGGLNKSLSVQTTGHYDGVVFELDTGSGQVAWAKPIRGFTLNSNVDRDERLYDVAYAPGGSVIATGTTSSDVLADDFGPPPSFTSPKVAAVDTFVLKIAQGTHIVSWAKRFGTVGSTSSVVATLGGSNIVALCGDHTIATDFGLGSINTNGVGDAFIMGLDGLTGTTKWQMGYGGTYRDQCSSLAADAKDNILAAGVHASATLTVGGKTLGDPPPRGTNGSLAAHTIKLDSAGKVLWAKTLTSTTATAMGAVIDTPTISVDGAGNVVTGGHFGGVVDFGDGKPVTPAVNSEIFVLRRVP